MSLKKKIVLKSDVKQLFTTTTTLLRVTWVVKSNSVFRSRMGQPFRKLASQNLTTNNKLIFLA